MTVTKPATKYFRPIMILSTILFLNRIKTHKIIYFLQNFAAFTIVSFNIYAISTNLFRTDILVYYHYTFDKIITLLVMIGLFSTAFVTYFYSSKLYTTLNSTIDLFNTADEYITSMNCYFENLQPIEQYSPWDCPVLVTCCTLAFLSRKTADFIAYGVNSINSVIAIVFFTGLVTFFHNVVIMVMFQRALVNKYKLLNNILSKVNKNNMQSVHRVEVVKNAKILWDLCNEVFKNYISVFGVNVLTICFGMYIGTVGNAYYIIYDQWTSFVYGIEGIASLAVLIYAQELVISEVM